MLKGYITKQGKFIEINSKGIDFLAYKISLMNDSLRENEELRVISPPKTIKDTFQMIVDAPTGFAKQSGEDPLLDIIHTNLKKYEGQPLALFHDMTLDDQIDLISELGLSYNENTKRIKAEDYVFVYKLENDERGDGVRLSINNPNKWDYHQFTQIKYKDKNNKIVKGFKKIKNKFVKEKEFQFKTLADILEEAEGLEERTIKLKDTQEEYSPYRSASVNHGELNTKSSKLSNLEDIKKLNSWITLSNDSEISSHISTKNGKKEITLKYGFSSYNIEAPCHPNTYRKITIKGKVKK